MAIMRQYTTPSYTLRVKGLDITGCDIYVSFGQNEEEELVRITNPTATYDGEDTLIDVTLTQADTAKFETRPGAIVQVNWYHNGDRQGSAQNEIIVRPNLLKEVLS